MQKIILLTAAALIFLFFNYGMYQWLQSGHTLGDAWQALQQDWLVAITFFDACVFSTLSIIWTVQDIKSRGWATGKIALLIAAILVFGVVALLVYLAYRKPVLEKT